MKEESPYKELGYWNSIKPEEWKECPVCKAKPTVWIFDNGKFAKCRCQSKYEHAVRGVSIWEYYQKHGHTEGYSNDDLRDNWNAYVDRKTTKV